MKPLQDFGFGKMSFMEGGVGLFVFAGVGASQDTLEENRLLALRKRAEIFLTPI